jgi:hypothetical protein
VSSLRIAILIELKSDYAIVDSSHQAPVNMMPVTCDG